jgi:hypothetical protein
MKIQYNPQWRKEIDWLFDINRWSPWGRQIERVLRLLENPCNFPFLGQDRATIIITKKDSNNLLFCYWEDTKSKYHW